MPPRPQFVLTRRTLALAGLATVLLCAAMGLRIVGLAEKLFWHDEVYTKIFVSGYQSSDWKSTLTQGRPVPPAAVTRFFQGQPVRGLTAIVRSLAVDDPHHPPLFYAAARVWMAAGGHSTVALRWFSVLTSLLLLPLMYLIGRELFANQPAAYLSAGLAAVSPVFVLYAQEVREYALWSVLIALTTWLLARALRISEGDSSTRERFLAWCAYSLSITLALYTSFSTATVVLAHAGAILLRWKAQTLVQGGVALAGAGLLFLPWALLLIVNLDSFFWAMKWSRDIHIARPDLLGRLALNLSRLLVDYQAAPGAPAALQALPVVAGLSAMVLAWGGWIGVSRGQVTLPLCLLFAPLLMLLLPDLLFGGIRSVPTRYLLPGLLGLLLLVAGGLAAHLSRRPRMGIVLTSVVMGMALVSSLHNATLREPWSKGISRGLPAVAVHINRFPRPLILADIKSHNPGNLLALTPLLRRDARVQLLATTHRSALVARQAALAPEATAVFILSPDGHFPLLISKFSDVQLQRVIGNAHFQAGRLMPVRRSP